MPHCRGRGPIPPLLFPGHLHPPPLSSGEIAPRNCPTVAAPTLRSSSPAASIPRRSSSRCPVRSVGRTRSMGNHMRPSMSVGRSTAAARQQNKNGRRWTGIEAMKNHGCWDLLPARWAAKVKQAHEAAGTAGAGRLRGGQPKAHKATGVAGASCRRGGQPKQSKRLRPPALLGPAADKVGSQGVASAGRPAGLLLLGSAAGEVESRGEASACRPATC